MNMHGIKQKCQVLVACAHILSRQLVCGHTVAQEFLFELQDRGLLHSHALLKSILSDDTARSITLNLHIWLVLLHISETNWILSNVSVRVLFYRHVEFGGMQDLLSLPAGCEPPVWTSIAPSGCKYNIKNKITVTLQHRLVIKNTELDKIST